MAVSRAEAAHSAASLKLNHQVVHAERPATQANDELCVFNAASNLQRALLPSHCSELRYLPQHRPWRAAFLRDGRGAGCESQPGDANAFAARSAAIASFGFFVPLVTFVTAPASIGYALWLMFSHEPSQAGGLD